ncbi:SDR family NAD(P)-dependent oxidoreductase [Streptomyces rishiriensis]|uniref:SDR family NAD(P)-dependent oxidoreductase n=1 Tax=Streptomyces rishiriensis TaxID=68264 RepID=UPI0037CD37A0
MPTALITEGTTGIGRATAGRATAELPHARGYQVAVTGQNPGSLARARSELPDDVLVVRSDGRVLSDTDALMSAVSARFGSLDLLFLNAGIFRPAPVAEVTEESFDEHADLNFKGQYFTLQKALPRMNDGGSIVLTVGIGSRRGTPGATVGGGDTRRAAGRAARSRSNWPRAGFASTP